MRFNINWYPGHMKKTIDSISKNLKEVDLVMEIIDARAPLASQNPMISEILGDKPKILVFNKVDLADPIENKRWIKYFEEKFDYVVPVNAQERRGIEDLLGAVDQVTEDKRARDKKKDIISTMTRSMIIGVPNVGKSTLINALAGRRGAKVGNRPGVTRTNQWIKVEDKFLLLDTPGVLWPKFSSEELALNLVYIGSIKDEIVAKEDIALYLIKKLAEDYPRLMENRYDLEITEDGLEMMEAIGRRRGAIMRGNNVDYTRVADLVLDEFRKGQIGRISLEKVHV